MKWVQHILLDVPCSVLVAILLFPCLSLNIYSRLQDWEKMVWSWTWQSMVWWLMGLSPHSNIQSFDILLCVKNKGDFVPSHSIQVEYRRWLQLLGDSFVEPCSKFSEYGLSENEGRSLLKDEELSWEISRSCLEWCSECNIEYIETCASNADFDKWLSVNGDSQGVDRILGAISALKRALCALNTPTPLITPHT